MAWEFRDAIACDVDDTFLSYFGEFARLRDFGVRGQSRTYEPKTLMVIWYQDTLRNIPAVVSYGQLEIGDVLCITRKCDWYMRPRREEILYSPRDTQWKVISSNEIMNVLYRIVLRAAIAT